MGGRFALLLAERRTDLTTTVVYYGGLGARDDADPIADAGKVSGSLLGHFGEEDRVIPLDQVSALESRLTEAGIRSAIRVYPDAGHAFNHDRNPAAYRPDAARLAWSQTIEWLKKEMA